jgi:RNA polymerase sigma factor (sigma-70 family)
MFKSLPSNQTNAPTDEALLERYRAGDAQALGTLYERYMPMVYGVCLKIYRDSGRAEDAVMGVFEELVRKLPNHQVVVFRGWLYTVARNYALMEWRKAQRNPTDHHAPDQMHLYDAVEQPFDVEMPRQTAPLEHCLQELNDTQRQSVLWFYYEDKSYHEIAELLREELGKVRSYIQNGRRNLRICLERFGAKNDYLT